jgi:hypothetical protein
MHKQLPLPIDRNPTFPPSSHFQILLTPSFCFFLWWSLLLLLSLLFLVCFAAAAVVSDLKLLFHQPELSQPSYSYHYYYYTCQDKRKWQWQWAPVGRFAGCLLLIALFVRQWLNSHVRQQIVSGGCQTGVKKQHTGTKIGILNKVILMYSMRQVWKFVTMIHLKAVRLLGGK